MSDEDELDSEPSSSEEEDCEGEGTDSSPGVDWHQGTGVHWNKQSGKWYRIDAACRILLIALSSEACVELRQLLDHACLLYTAANHTLEDA